MNRAREEARRAVFDYCQNDRKSHSVKDYADIASGVWESIALVLRDHMPDHDGICRKCRYGWPCPERLEAEDAIDE